MKKVGLMTKIAAMAISVFGFSAMFLANPVSAALDCTGAGCASDGASAVDPEGGSGAGLEDTVKTIINVVIYVIGLIAVVMIILGGISYTTSQGDAGKVKKAKDTILYGIIGLVVAILAYAIVNFVLQNIFE